MRVSSQGEYKELTRIQLARIKVQQVQCLPSQIAKYIIVVSSVLRPLLLFCFFWPNSLISFNFSSSKVSTDTRIQNYCFVSSNIFEVFVSKVTAS